ncbi:uncharacterized protein LOC109820754, partial [Asparagus officinalis]|uniref:uncharacterized protein LOC109820754 n=1 Tax=Asparagus officinalis TaxID=4686 RepID=UPI00098E1519
YFLAGNPANEIIDLLNQNRTASKLPKLFDSPGLGCMALQYISECILNCSSNNTLKCQPSEVDITEVYAPNCGVELPTVETISGKITGCQWKYLNPEEAFSEILVTHKKELSLIHSKEHTEVGVALRRVKKGASFWCILFSTGKTNSSFVLEGGRGIEQKTGCFSGIDQPCSDGRKVVFLDDIMNFGFVILVYAFVFGVQM